VVLRFGRLAGEKEPGLNLILPFGIDKLTRIDMRTLTVEVPQQEVITQDNVPVKVSTVIWYRTIDATKAVTAVTNPEAAVVMLALTTLRSVIGTHKLEEVLKSQDTISAAIKKVVDLESHPWGLQVSRVEMQNIEIPESMQRAMAQVAEAEREKQAREIKAEAELNAANKLAEAADRIAQHPIALELRRMQMITEVGAEQNTSTILMMPTEFVNAAQGIASMAQHFGGKAKD
jgi:regulator of protease activity HflC (stomatin/prohibitin superfamily)